MYMLVKAVADGHPGREGVRSQLQHRNFNTATRSEQEEEPMRRFALAFMVAVTLAAPALAASNSITVGPDPEQSWDLGGFNGLLTFITTGFTASAVLNGTDVGTVSFGQTTLRAGPGGTGGIFPVTSETPAWAFTATFPDGSATGTIAVAQIVDGVNPMLVGTFTVTKSTGVLAPTADEFKPPLQFTAAFVTPPASLTSKFFDVRDGFLSAKFTWGTCDQNCTCTCQ
jgi:hypothetical protein